MSARALLAAALLAAGAGPAAAQDEPVKIRRALAGLELGQRLADVKREYPPSGEWPSVVAARGRIKRYRVDRSAAKAFPARADTLFLGFEEGRLREIQVVYDAEQTRRQPAQELARELSLQYGEPRQSGERFWWADDRTVLRALKFEAPRISPDGVRSIELRASVQLCERRLCGVGD